MSDTVGVAIVGHGETASALLSALRGLLGPSALPGAVAVDAGVGETAEHSLQPQVCAGIEKVDVGAGVLVLVDLVGASPCQCAERDAADHGVVLLGGLNLAMLMKLATLDRDALTPAELAARCSDTGRRAVAVRRAPEQPAPTADGADEEVAS